MPIHGLSESLYPTKPSHFNLESIIRPNILALHPYRCARDDYSEGILLDANENSLGHSIHPRGTTKTELDEIEELDLHRYPSPTHEPIKSRIANIRNLPGPEHVFLGVGSDEVIDLLIRVIVKPGGQEKILITPPTYGMYSVCAQINDVGIVKVPLQLEPTHGEGGENGRFSLRVDKVKEAIDADPSIKIIFLCSPGNPSGTTISLSSIKRVLDYEKFKGIVVVDEAYIDFADPSASAISLVSEYANLCVAQTLSKSFGLADIRLGIAIAHPALIHVLNNAKAPYNVSTPTAYLALRALSPESIHLKHNKILMLNASRVRLLQSLSTIPAIGAPIGANEANFVMVPVLDKDGKKDTDRAQAVYKTLAEEEGVVVRFRGKETGCEACLRITVGTEEENEKVIEKLREILED